MPKTFTVKEVAELLGYSTNTVYALLKQKRIKGVRLGKGRFRIPESEVKQIFTLSEHVVEKEQASESMSPEKFSLCSKEIEQTSTPFILPMIDWIIGMIAFLIGCTMFLFTANYGQLPYIATLWNTPARLMLLIGGFGMMVIILFARTSSVWRTAYRILLFIGYVGFASVAYVIHDIDAVLFGVSMSVILGLLMIRPCFTIERSILLLSILLGIGSSSICWIWPTWSVFVQTTQAYVPDFRLFCILWTISVILFIVLQIRNMLKRSLIVRHLLLFLFVMWNFSVAGIYVWALSWEKAFFCLGCMFWGIISAFEINDPRKHPYMQSVVYIILTVGVVLQLGLLGGVHIYEQTVKEFVGKQLETGALNGASYLTSVIDAARLSLQFDESKKQQVIAAIQKQDRDILTGFLKTEFAEHAYFRRYILIGTDGKEVAHYPLDEALLKNRDLSFRQYFIQTMGMKREVITDGFENIQMPTQTSIVITNPIVDTKTGDVIAVFVGSLDLDFMNMKLQEFATIHSSEYFVVFDKTGKRIIDPNPLHKGSFTGFPTLSFERYWPTNELYSADGVRVFGAYGKMTDPNWVIVGMQPMVEAFRTSAIFYIFLGIELVIVLCSCSIAGIYCYMQYMRPKKGIGP